MRAGKMTSPVKLLTTRCKPDNLSLLPRNRIKVERTNSTEFYFDLHTLAMHTHPPTCKQQNNMEVIVGYSDT